MVRQNYHLKNIILLWFSTGLAALLTFITQLLIANKFSLEDFGIFSFCLTAITIIGSLSSFGIGGYWLYIFGMEGEKAKSVIKPSMHYQLFLSSIALFSLGFWAIFIDQFGESSKICLYLATCILGQVVVDTVGLKYMVENRRSALAKITVINPIIRFLFILIVCGTLEISINLVAIGYSIISLIILLIYHKEIFSLYTGKTNIYFINQTKFNIPKYSALGMFRFTWTYGLEGIVYLIYIQAGLLLMKYFLNFDDIAIYSAANILLVGILTLPSTLYQKYINQRVGYWYHHNRKFYFMALKYSTFIMLFLGLISGLALFLFAEIIVNKLYGNKYSESILIIQVFSIGLAARFTTISFSSFLSLQNYRFQKLLIGLSALLVNIVLIFLVGSLSKIDIIDFSIIFVISEIFLAITFLIYFILRVRYGGI
jgi:O-antigen/teichoic acid export membrane protein